MKKGLKKVFKLLFRALLLPVYLWFEVLSRLTHEDSAFQSISQYLSLLPGKLGSYCRAAFLWWTCPGTSDDISIGFMTLFSHRDTTIEPGVYIGPQCNIGMCTIEKNTLIGSGTHILSGKKQHMFGTANVLIKDNPGIYKKINVGQNTWIGNCAMVMADIGDNSVVAAGTVVTKTFPGNSILAGNPAEAKGNVFRSDGSND